MSVHKKRVLSGIQPSGKLHLGNYFGMMSRMIEYQQSNDLFCFIVNYHALTTIHDKNELKDNTINAALDFLALGMDPEKSTFWVQSDVPQVTELTWLLSNMAGVGLMERSTSYKDKIEKGLKPHMGLFSYPVLMAADILLYGSDIVPVGKDQKQHLEITRDIAIKFNNTYGDILIIPEASINQDTKLIPGIDGQKMSKSKNNVIDIFQNDKKLRKQIMSIKTDSTPLEEPKDWNSCNCFALYELLASAEEIAEMKKNYEGGNYGYGHAKQALFELICKQFSDERERYNHYIANPDEIVQALALGAEKANAVANKVLSRVRQKLGY